MSPAHRWLAPPLLVLALMSGASTAHAQAQALYWLDGNWAAPTLNRSDVNGLGVSSVPLAAGSLPEGLAVSSTSGRIYWTQAVWSNANIEQTAPPLAGSGTPIVTGGSALRGIAIDDTTGLMYWTASNLATGSAIYRASVNGSGIVPLVFLGGLANPRGITIDHAGGKIYWTDFDQNAIWSANLDGTSPTQWLPLPPGSEPYGIVVDPVAHMLYWTEYGTGFLRRSPTFGPSPMLTFSGLANPTYLTLDRLDSQLYWIDSGTGSQHLKRGPTNGGSILFLPPAITSYGGLAFQVNATLDSPSPEPPRELALDHAWPTPSRGAVHVSFALPRAAHARLVVLDLQGREVAVLADDDLPAGRQERVWQSGAGPRPVAAGVYFARLSVEGRHFVQRIALVP